MPAQSDRVGDPKRGPKRVTKKTGVVRIDPVPLKQESSTADDKEAATKIQTQFRGRKAREGVLDKVSAQAASSVPDGKPWDGDLAAFSARAKWSKLRRMRVGRGDSATGFVNKALEALMPVVIRGAEKAILEFLGQSGGLPLGVSAAQ